MKLQFYFSETQMNFRLFAITRRPLVVHIPLVEAILSEKNLCFVW